MITFKKFLEGIQSYESAPRTATIDLEAALKLIEQNCKGYLSSSGAKTGIFRGFKMSGNAAFGDSNAGNPRVSANTFNYYTLWMDNDPAWSKFPKRSRSFICSESDSVAEGFAMKSGYETCYIFPYDDAKIGACPTDDLWQAFETRGVSSLSTFMRAVHEGFKQLRDDGDTNFDDYPETYKELVKLLKLLTEDRISELRQKLQHDRKDSSYLTMLAHYIDDYGQANSAFELFKHVLDPVDFELYKPSNFVNEGDRELFIQGNIVAIEKEIAESEVVKEFFKKHGI